MKSMDKFQVAHEWAMKFGKSTTIIDRENTVDYAWEYADAMQAEADKRKEKGVPDVLKSNEHNWENVTVMGDNVAKFVCADCGVVKNGELEWQPDWINLAPTGFDWFIKQYDGSSHFLNVKPDLTEDYWRTYTHARWIEVGIDCPVNWRNSLRKRPQ